MFGIAIIFIVVLLGQLIANTLAVGIEIEWFGKLEGKMFREGLVILKIDSDQTCCKG